MKQTPGRRLATGSHGATAGPPLVTFTSDFGTGSPLVAAMKAMVLAGCPHATLVDVSHEVPHFDVFAGAFMLFAGTRHFGPASVHLAVVDPGVGSARRRLAIRAGGRFYVGPDNGLFGIVIEEVGMQQAVELAPMPGGAPTFEGRDVFAPAAAALASGVPLESLGHPTSSPTSSRRSGRCAFTTTTSRPRRRLMRRLGRTSRSFISAAWDTSRSASARRAPTGCLARGRE